MLIYNKTGPGIMHRLRTRKTLVLFSLGVALFASFLPFVATGFTAILTPLWLVFQAAVVAIIRRSTRCDEQPVSLLSLVLSRGPPASGAVA